ncbi:hypothetical protein HDU97_001694 [Phlyctochytrium planicorne]|nr:hypothetical protein HDU97_001694 [Phlyctochytrium planicorne]
MPSLHAILLVLAAIASISTISTTTPVNLNTRHGEHSRFAKRGGASANTTDDSGSTLHLLPTTKNIGSVSKHGQTEELVVIPVFVQNLKPAGFHRSSPFNLLLMGSSYDGKCSPGLENQFICNGVNTLRRCLASGPVDFACPTGTYCCSKDDVAVCRDRSSCDDPNMPSSNSPSQSPNAPAAPASPAAPAAPATPDAPNPSPAPVQAPAGNPNAAPVQRPGYDGVCTPGLENQFICYGSTFLRRCLASGPVDFTCPPGTACCFRNGVSVCDHKGTCEDSNQPNPSEAPSPSPAPEAPSPTPTDANTLAPDSRLPPEPTEVSVTPNPNEPSPMTETAWPTLTDPNPDANLPAPELQVPQFGYCDGASPARIGFIESWSRNFQGPCKFDASKVDYTKWTHLFYAFGQIDPETSRLVLPAEDAADMQTFLNNKTSLVLSIGGWGNHKNFGKVAASWRAQKNFSDSVLEAMEKYKFVGIDIDWEYPVETQKEQFGSWIVQLRRAFGPTRVISVSAPMEPVIYNYPLEQIAKYADFLNIMAYDDNGSWSKATGPNTDKAPFLSVAKTLTEANFPSQKLIYGMAFYGRTFRLTNATATQTAQACKGYNCPFTKDIALRGQCSQEPGLLFANEIETLRRYYNPVRDEATLTSYLVTKSNDLVTFDTKEDLQAKDALAKQMCLGGAMVWSIDQDPYQTINPF